MPVAGASAMADAPRCSVRVQNLTSEMLRYVEEDQCPERPVNGGFGLCKIHHARAFDAGRRFARHRKVNHSKFTNELRGQYAYTIREMFEAFGRGAVFEMEEGAQ